MNTRNSILVLTLLCASVASLTLIAHSNPSTNAQSPDMGSIPFVNAAAKAEANIPLDFYYNVEPRFMTRLTREQVQHARSFAELFPSQKQEIDAYNQVDIIVFDEQYTTTMEKKGSGKFFTEEQIDLLQSMEYSTNFRFHVEYEQSNPATGAMEKKYMTPHITIVPEREAEYLPGRNKMTDYLKSNSKEAVSDLQKDKLKAGRVYFTIGENGTIVNVRTVNTCGYPSVDALMLNLIANMPGKWDSATNAAGASVPQELVLTYGIQGC